MSDPRSDDLRLALIGCGNMGLRYVLALAQMAAAGYTGIRLAALCDVDESRARELAAYAASHGLGTPRVVPDLDRLLTDPGVEAVSVVLPNHLHAEAVCLALDAGKHVLVEKPMTISLPEADRIGAARRAGRILAVAENFRRIPSNRAFAALLAAGVLGTPLRMDMRREASPDESYMVGRRRVDGPPWYHDPDLSGSYHVFELGAHEIDLQTAWFGSVATLRARAVTAANGLKTTSISLRFASGVASEIEFRDTDSPDERFLRRFETSLGSAESRTWSSWQDGEIALDGEPPLDLGAMTARYLGALAPDDRERLFPRGSSALGLTAQPADPLSYGVGIVLADFARAVRQGSAPEVGFDDGRAVVRICAAISASIAAGGSWIRPDPDRPPVNATKPRTGASTGA